MKINKINYIMIMSLLTAILISGCEKDSIFGKKNSDILKFESNDDFLKASNLNRSMSHEERSSWEKANGFASFGSKCDELYFSINPEKFQTQEELFAFVEKNSDYLQLIEDETGEWTLETKLHVNPMRYFANEKMIFQIGDDVVKVFETSSVKTQMNNVDELIQLSSSNFDEYEESGRFSLFNQVDPMSVLNLKDATHNCGTDRDDRATSGKERIYLRISMERLDTSFGPLVQSSYMIRPYYKVLGVWYWTKRILKCELKVSAAMYVKDINGWHNQTGEYSNTGENTRSLSGILTEYLPGNYGSFHFDAINSWATQHKVSESAILSCNAPLIP
jgi:hypothetical protein